MQPGQLEGGSRRALILARELEAELRRCHTTPHFARLDAVITCCETVCPM